MRQDEFARYYLEYEMCPCRGRVVFRLVKKIRSKIWNWRTHVRCNGAKERGYPTYSGISRSPAEIFREISRIFQRNCDFTVVTAVNRTVAAAGGSAARHGSSSAARAYSDVGRYGSDHS